MLDTIKHYFSGGYNPPMKLVIIFFSCLIFFAIITSITNGLDLTNHKAKTRAKYLAIGDGVGYTTAKDYYDSYDVPNTHDTVDSINWILSLLFSVFILIKINNRKKSQLINGTEVKTDE